MPRRSKTVVTLALMVALVAGVAPLASAESQSLSLPQQQSGPGPRPTNPHDPKVWRPLAQRALEAVREVESTHSEDARELFQDAAPAPGPLGTIVWEPCGAGLGNLECGTVAVPLDHARPSGPTIDVALARRRAGDPRARVGSLLVNPGGPGGSGVELVAFGSETFSPELRARFDIVGFDPRGVGLSGAITCADPELLLSYLTADRTPDDPGEADQLVELNRQYGAACAAGNGALLNHVDTASTARDIDVIRAGLGERQINWLGFSYGTQLGAAYAELFPGRVRAMALDAALDHSIPLDALAVSNAVGFDRAFARFAQACAASPDCPVEGDVGAVFDQIVAAAEDNPLPVQNPFTEEDDVPEEIVAALTRPVTDTDIHLTFLGALPAGEEAFPFLAVALAAAQQGDGSLFSFFGGAIVADEPGSGEEPGPERPEGPAAPGDEPDTTEAVGEEDGRFPGDGSFRAIFCQDWPSVADDADDVEVIADRAAVAAPRFGRPLVWELVPNCIDWPAPVVNPPHVPRIVNQPPILVIGGTYDPSTPYEWSEAYRAQIPRSVLLTREGDGHVSYPRSSCIARLADHYLVQVRTPGPNRRCPTDRPLFSDFEPTPAQGPTGPGRV